MLRYKYTACIVCVCVYNVEFILQNLVPSFSLLATGHLSVYVVAT